MPAEPHIRRTSGHRGFTLAESLVASVVLAMAVVGVSGAIVASQQQSNIQQEDAVAVALARQLMEEIASRPIVLSGGSSGAAGWPGVTNRDLYDTIDDYNGYRDTIDGRSQLGRNSTATIDASATPAATVNSDGTTPPALTRQQYRRSVNVAFPTSIFGTTVAGGEFAVVTVRVVGGGGSRIQLSRLVGKSTVVR